MDVTDVFDKNSLNFEAGGVLGESFERDKSFFFFFEISKRVVR